MMDFCLVQNTTHSLETLKSKTIDNNIIKCPQPKRLVSHLKIAQQINLVSSGSKREESLKNPFDEAEKEIQSILQSQRSSPFPKQEKNSPILEANHNHRSPLFYPKAINPKQTIPSEKIAEVVNLRSSTTNLFRAFSHSPCPSFSPSIRNEECIVDSSSEEIEIIYEPRSMIIEPPIRSNNPIIFNSPFVEDKKPKIADVEIGLLSVSPPPIIEDSQLKRIKKS